ncbi:MAG: hypothetical protein JXL81_12600 [Deltaproteobacteria bacterium]|nr:hypothetical protein [Deltaproteobacteria bacterium]
MPDIYNEIKKRAFDTINKDLLDTKITVKARALSTEEAIGNPESDDFPLMKGKERLMHAELDGAAGQAFTDQYGDFEGTLKDILESDLSNNYRRAIFIASLNAALRHMGLAEGTIHCRDKEPGECAVQLVEHIKSKYGSPKITQIGFQPKFVEEVSASFDLRVVDLDKDNIGTKKYNTLIEGPDKTEEAIEWADLLLVTGTTIVNGTIEQFLNKKPVLFYGTTIAAVAHLMGWDRFCAKGR